MSYLLIHSLVRRLSSDCIILLLLYIFSPLPVLLKIYPPPFKQAKSGFPTLSKEVKIKIQHGFKIVSRTLVLASWRF